MEYWVAESGNWLEFTGFPWHLSYRSGNVHSVCNSVLAMHLVMFDLLQNCEVLGLIRSYDLFSACEGQ